MEHRDITGLNNHEPKGIEDAASGEVYVADGAGSGTWQDLDIPTGAFTPDIRRYVLSGDWTKPPGLFAIKVIVQAEGGAAGNGAASSFGGHCSATGGTTSAGGTATGGDINISGTFEAADLISFGHFMPYGVGRPGGGAQAGGGGCAIKWIAAGDLAGTETVTVGASGTGSSNGIVVVEEYVFV